MKIKTLALILCASFCVGLSSCKDDGRQDLPKVVKTESGVNPENTGGHAKYTGPMTHLQVSMTATYPAPVASKSRAFNTSFTKGSSDNNLMQINWEKDKVYKLRVCVRPKRKDYSTGSPDGWHVDDGPYADFTGKVIDISGETYKKDGKQYGTGGTLRIQGTIDVPTSFIEAKDIYFAAFIYTEADGVKVESIGPIAFQLPKMVAVHNPQNNTNNTEPNIIPTMSVLTAIPFTNVTFVKEGSKYKMVKADGNGNEDKANKEYNIKPILTLFHFKVTNRMSRPIRFPEAQNFSFPKSSVAFGVGILFDFWKFPQQLNSIGTDNFFFHFGKIVIDQEGNTENPVTAKNYSVGVDYSNVPSDLQTTVGNQKYIQLQPNNSIDFYVAGAPVLDPTDSGSPAFEIDLSSLGIQYQAKDQTWVDYRAKYKTLYAYSDGRDNDGNAVSDMSKSLKEDINPLYFSAKNAAADNYKQGASYYKSFEVSSDLMIDLIGYRWDGVSGKMEPDGSITNIPTRSHGNNFSLVQLYNATSDNVDLKNYYLVRTIYNYPNSGDVKFCSNGWDFTPNLAYAVLCPLVSDQVNAKEFSPLGYNDKSVKYEGEQSNTGYRAFYTSLPGHSYIPIIEPGHENDYRPINASSGSVSIIGAAGFYGKKNLTIDTIKDKYSTEYGANYVNTGDWNDVRCVFAIKDGRYDKNYKATQTDKYPTNANLDCYTRVPGNPGSGVMSRGNGSGVYSALGDDTYSEDKTIGAQTINGWALVKKVPVGDRTKFVIVDTFGPCPTEDNNASNCSQFISGFGTNDYSPLVFLRNPKICQPYGAQMDLTDPKTNDPSSSNKGWTKYISWYHSGSGFGPQEKPMIGVINR